ncbi:MAG: biotin/lipoyl-containing protein [Myxococcota bacterium]|nr:biotin/lipoyl-containing protein [Myxococcota bacterium]
MRYTIVDGHDEVLVEVRPLTSGQFWVRVDDQPAKVVDAFVDGQLVHYIADGRSHIATLTQQTDTTHIYTQGESHAVQLLDSQGARRRSRRREAGPSSGNLSIKSPMPGRIVKVLVSVGQAVEAGEGVIIVEAMKMENELRAETAGIVEHIHVQSDDRVEGNASLITLRAPEGVDP